MKVFVSSNLRMLFASGFLIFLSSCTWKKEEFVMPKVDTTTTTTVDTCTKDIKYEPHIRRILSANCANFGCHVPGGQGNGDFTNYAGIHAKVTSGAFFTRVLGPGHDMPPTFSPGPTSLSDCDFRKMKAWYDAGGPQ